MAKAGSVVRGDTFDFTFDLDGESLIGWKLDILVRRFTKGDIFVFRGDIPATGDQWVSFLTQEETANLPSNSNVPYQLIGIAENSSTGERRSFKQTFEVTASLSELGPAVPLGTIPLDVLEVLAKLDDLDDSVSEAAGHASDAQGHSTDAQGHSGDAQVHAGTASADAASVEADRVRAETAADESEAAAGSIGNAVQEATDEAAAALLSRNQAEGFKNEASQSATDGAASETAASASASAAGAHVISALSLKNQTEGFRDETEGFRNEAEGFKDGAETAADTATTEVASIGTSVADAALSATEAKSSEDASALSEIATGQDEALALSHSQAAGTSKDLAEGFASSSQSSAILSGGSQDAAALSETAAGDSATESADSATISTTKAGEASISSAEGEVFKDLAETAALAAQAVSATVYLHSVDLITLTDLANVHNVTTTQDGTGLKITSETTAAPHGIVNLPELVNIGGANFTNMPFRVLIEKSRASVGKIFVQTTDGTTINGETEFEVETEGGQYTFVADISGQNYNVLEPQRVDGGFNLFEEARELVSVSTFLSGDSNGKYIAVKNEFGLTGQIVLPPLHDNQLTNFVEEPYRVTIELDSASAFLGLNVLTGDVDTFIDGASTFVITEPGVQHTFIRRASDNSYVLITPPASKSSVTTLANRVTVNEGDIDDVEAAAITNAAAIVALDERVVANKAERDELYHENVLLTGPLAKHNGVKFVTTAQAVSPRAVAFNADESLMIVLDNAAADLFSYNVPAGGIGAGVTYTGKSFSVNSDFADVRGMEWRPGGRTFWLCGTELGTSQQVIKEYDVPIAYDLQSGITVTSTLNVNSVFSTVRAVSLSDDGDKLFILGADTATNASIIREDDLNVFFSLASAVATGNILNVNELDTAMQAMTWKPGGRILELLGGDGSDFIHEVTVSTGFDIGSTVRFTEIKLFVRFEDGTPRGITFSKVRNILYMVGDLGNLVLAYDLRSQFTLGFQVLPENNGNLLVVDSFNEPVGIYLPDSVTLPIDFRVGVVHVRRDEGPPTPFPTPVIVEGVDTINGPGNLFIDLTPLPLNKIVPFVIAESKTDWLADIPPIPKESFIFSTAKTFNTNFLLFDDIPIGTRRVLMSWNKLKTGNSGAIEIQMGTLGGLETTGYGSSGSKLVNSNHSSFSSLFSTARVNIPLESNDDATGMMDFTLLDPATGEWVFTWQFADVSQTTELWFGAGSKTLASDLRQIRIKRQTNSGTSSGKINMQYFV